MKIKPRIDKWGCGICIERCDYLKWVKIRADKEVCHCKLTGKSSCYGEICPIYTRYREWKIRHAIKMIKELEQQMEDDHLQNLADGAYGDFLEGR